MFEKTVYEILLGDTSDVEITHYSLKCEWKWNHYIKANVSAADLLANTAHLWTGLVMVLRK